MKTYKQLVTEMNMGNTPLRQKKAPPQLAKMLGSWAKNVVGFDHSDKGIHIKFNSSVDKQELAKKLKVKHYDVEKTNDGSWYIRIHEDEEDD